MKLITLTARFASAEDGVTGIEYALIAGLVSIMIVGALTTIGLRVAAMFAAAAAAFP